MAAMFRSGDKAYIIDNGIRLCEVTVIKATRDLCIVKYIDTGAIIRIRKSRLYNSKDEANKALPQKSHHHSNHWNYY